MSEKTPVDEPRREKQTMDGPQEEFIQDNPPSRSQNKESKPKEIWDDSWRPEDKAMESAEKEALGVDQNDDESKEI
jgi:hypothetical protein